MSRRAFAFAALVMCLAAACVLSTAAAAPVGADGLAPSVRRLVVCPARYVGVCCKLRRQDGGREAHKEEKKKEEEGQEENETFLTLANACFCAERRGEVAPDHKCAKQRCACPEHNDSACCLIDGTLMAVLNDCVCKCNGGTTPYAGCAPFLPSV